MSTVDHRLTWPGNRPYVGASLLIVGGLMVGYVPFQFALELIHIGGAFAVIGLVYSVLITLAGVFALLRPGLAAIMGGFGIILSYLSFVGAMGGLLIGVLLTVLGGGLCILWWVLRLLIDASSDTTG